MFKKKTENEDYYNQISSMFATSAWKVFKTAIKADYDKLSRLVTLDAVKTEQINAYKDICRAYDILINLEENEARKLHSVANKAKPNKKQIYE